MLHVDELTQATLETNKQSADYAKIVTLLRRLLPSKTSKSDDDKITAIMHDRFWQTLKHGVKDAKQRKAYKAKIEERLPGYFGPLVDVTKTRPVPQKIKPKDEFTREDLERLVETAFLLNQRIKISTFEELSTEDKIAVIASEYPEIEHSVIARHLDCEAQYVTQVVATYGLANPIDGVSADSRDIG